MCGFDSRPGHQGPAKHGMPDKPQRRFPTSRARHPHKNAGMVHNQSSHSWLGRFCLQLMRMKPGLNVIVAVKHAVATQPYAAELEPERAARIFVDTNPGVLDAKYRLRPSKH